MANNDKTDTKTDKSLYLNKESERAALWNRENKERHHEAQKRYRQKNADKIKQSRPSKEVARAYHKKWRENPENLAKVKVWNKRWAKLHPVELRLFANARRAKLQGTKVVKEEISNWDSKICGICKVYIEGAFHIDHVVPISRGGLHEVANLQFTHPFCNTSKHNKLMSELVLEGAV